jgi:hypothetical protein
VHDGQVQADIYWFAVPPAFLAEMTVGHTDRDVLEYRFGPTDEPEIHSGWLLTYYGPRRFSVSSFDRWKRALALRLQGRPAEARRPPDLAAPAPSAFQRSRAAFAVLPRSATAFHPSIPPHQVRPSFGHLAPFVGCTAASADALVLFVSVAQGDAPASSGARGLRQKAAIGAAGKRWRKQCEC